MAQDLAPSAPAVELCLTLARPTAFRQAGQTTLQPWEERFQAGRSPPRPPPRRDTATGRLAVRQRLPLPAIRVRASTLGIGQHPSHHRAAKLSSSWQICRPPALSPERSPNTGMRGAYGLCAAAGRLLREGLALCAAQAPDDGGAGRDADRRPGEPAGIDRRSSAGICGCALDAGWRRTADRPQRPPEARRCRELTPAGCPRPRRLPLPVSRRGAPGARGARASWALAPQGSAAICTLPHSPVADATDEAVTTGSASAWPRPGGICGWAAERALRSRRMHPHARPGTEEGEAPSARATTPHEYRRRLRYQDPARIPKAATLVPDPGMLLASPCFAVSATPLLSPSL